MSLSPGTRLGPYEITAPIGAGGMGEVYRARDTTLDRDVAIKVLSEAFAADAERLARFEREAKVLASLNHTNIGHIYGLEQSGDTRALVLELVEGPTLADRIARGPIPLDEALPIATQIAHALEAAHEQGIIHRDLKPANVKVKADGTVKVLDFGLAKALTDESSAGALLNSPTITAMATRSGMILGTMPYMSPEQAKGKLVDRGTDVWAFGAVLYEMLTGQRAFPGSDVSETLVAILSAEVDLTALPAALPPAGQRLLRRCFEREPRKRLRHLTEGLLQVGEELEGRSGGLSPTRTVAPPPGPARRVWPWVAAIALAAVTGFATWALRPPPTPLSRDALSVTLPDDVDFGGGPVALSPDGHDLVDVGVRDGTRQLYHRRLDRVEAVPIVGTEGAAGPFFSPDGQWIGFRAESMLRKVPLAGGSAVTVCDLPARVIPGGGATTARSGSAAAEGGSSRCPTPVVSHAR